MSNRVVKCSKCEKTTTEDDAFVLDGKSWICKECLIIQEAMSGLSQVGVKNDQSKLRVDLVPPQLIAYDAAIYTMGAAKYGDDNWKNGLAYRRVLGAAVRHVLQRCMGDRIDAESGLPHLAHARWNIGALIYYDLYPDKYATFDDMTEACAPALELFNKYMEK